jgi:predicted GIY-YIG superfamily endonuclease
MTDLDSLEGYPEKVRDLEGEAHVYVLELLGGHYYVGVTKAPQRRVVDHARGAHTSPKWVKMYPPVAVDRVLSFADRERAHDVENQLTRGLAAEHGPGKVRGGSWTDPGERPPIYRDSGE